MSAEGRHKEVFSKFEPRRYGVAVATEAQREQITGDTAYGSIFEPKEYGGEVTTRGANLNL